MTDTRPEFTREELLAEKRRRESTQFTREELLAEKQRRSQEQPLGEMSWWDNFLMEFAKGPDGTIMSGPIGYNIDSQQWASRLPSLEESAKRVLGGLVSGITFGALEPFSDEPETYGSTSYKVSEFIGMAAPLGLVGKVVGAIPRIGKASGAVAGVARSGITGLGVGAIDQAVNSIKEGEFSVGDIILEGGAFAALDVILRSGGKVLRSIIKSRDVKKVSEEIRSAITDGQIKEMSEEEIAGLAGNIASGKQKLVSAAYTDLEKSLVVNIRQAKTPANMKPFQQLKYPAVTGGELETIMSIAPEDIPATRFGQAVKGIKRGLESPIRMHERYGTKEIMYEPIREAGNNAVKRIKQVEDEFDSYIKSRFSFRKRAKASERIMIYAASRQPGGADVLRRQGIDSIPELTKAEEEAYLFMREKLEPMYDELSKVRISVGLEPFRKIEDYFSFFRTLEGEIERGIPFLNVSASRAARAPKLQPKSTMFRFARKRIVDEYGGIQLDAFNIFRRYMSSAIRHAEMSPAIAKANQLLDGEFINGFRLMEHNPIAHSELRGWLNFVSGVEKHNLPDWVEAGIGILNRNLSFSVLVANARSAAIQPTAIWNAATHLGPKWVIRGVSGLFSKKTRDFIMKSSHTLAGREHDIAIQEALTGVRGVLRGVRSRAARLGIKPLQMLDLETAKATWWGAYQKGQQVYGMAHRDAVLYADDIVVRTQGSAARVDLAPIQRSALGKSISLFQTFVINNWGFLTKDVAGLGIRGQRLNAQNMRRVMRYIAGASIINTMFEDVLGIRSPFPAPIKEYKRRIKDGDPEAVALANAAREVAEVVPIVGGAVRYGGHPFGAVATTLYDAVSETKRGKITPRTIDVLGRLTGIPGTRQMYKLLRDQEKGGGGRTRPGRGGR